MADNDRVISIAPVSRRAATAALKLSPSRLRDARIAKRLTQTELAARVGVTRQAISGFEQGQVNPEPTTMGRIATEVAQPLSYFLASDPPVFGNLSPRFFRAIGPDTKRRNLACDVLSTWLAQTAKYFDQFVNYPPLNLPVADTPKGPDGRYQSDEIEIAAEQTRTTWGLGQGPISNVVTLLENKGVIVSRYVIPDENVEAFSFWNGGKAFVFLASQKDSACRSRFDTAHELGHLVLHRWIGPEELENPKTLKLIEREANHFAGAFLMPQKSFPCEVYTTKLDAFVALKHRWKTAIQAMVYRCKELDVIDEDQYTNLYKQISWRRWRTREPLDESIPLEEPRLLGRAVELVLSSGSQTSDDISAAVQINRRDIEQFCNLPKGALNTKEVPHEFRPTLK
jgi:Zn-dependent peptidase ImmA (M78 family)/transcriptional regulator with XRE-family HTH domain